jgi:spore maturation protein CgeB
VTLAMWAYDSAQHVSRIKKIVNDYNFVYFYEPNDLSLFPNLANTRFLPMAYDPRYYYPIHSDEANLVDICFVGSFGDYPTRRETILRLARKFPNLVLEVSSGPRWKYSPFRIQDRLRFGGRSNLRFERRSLPHDEINRIYNRARICLNIHHAQSTKAVNPRTFEILGSGGFLMTDRRMEGLSDFEIGRDYELYSSYDELFEKVTYYLQNPEVRKLISISGYERVRQNHTYQCRAMSILKDLEKNA